MPQRSGSSGAWASSSARPSSYAAIARRGSPIRCHAFAALLWSSATSCQLAGQQVDLGAQRHEAEVLRLRDHRHHGRERLGVSAAALERLQPGQPPAHRLDRRRHVRVLGRRDRGEQALVVLAQRHRRQPARRVDRLGHRVAGRLPEHRRRGRQLAPALAQARHPAVEQLRRHVPALVRRARRRVHRTQRSRTRRGCSTAVVALAPRTPPRSRAAPARPPRAARRPTPRPAPRRPAAHLRLGDAVGGHPVAGPGDRQRPRRAASQRRRARSGSRDSAASRASIVGQRSEGSTASPRSSTRRSHAGTFVPRC
jgi:hypothetical protein